MKPYFAKYLPVEGEIKEGDWLYNPHLKELFQNNFHKDGIIRPILGSRKVKLFLCSRDIQVGDKCYHERHIALGESTTRDEKNAVYTFKVIGEISPEAKWVKEGDEFDKNEVDILDLYELTQKEKDILYFTNKKEYLNRYSEDNWLVKRKYFKNSMDVPEKKGSFVYIRCSNCKHFH